MYRRMYQSLYHRPSGPVRPTGNAIVVVSPLRMPASGVPGARSLRFATPGPWPVPCLSARTSRGTDARWRSLQARGQGCAPAPRLAALARRWRVVKPVLFRSAIPSPRAIQGGVRGGVCGAVRWGGLQSVIDLMQEALHGSDPGWRQLPAIRIGAKWYFTDEQLTRLRNINNPQDAIEILKV